MNDRTGELMDSESWNVQVLGQGPSHFSLYICQQRLFVQDLNSSGNRGLLRIIEQAKWSVIPAAKTLGDLELLDLCSTRDFTAGLHAVSFPLVLPIRGKKPGRAVLLSY